jgi:hypothetical protein
VETKSINEELIARYLLGELSEEEQVRLEDLAFSDREFLQEILAVESDLIDEYARGELSDSRRRQFESRFLTSAERRQKVEFARAFAKVVPEGATERAVRPVVVDLSTSWWDSLKSLLSNFNPPVKFAMAAAVLMLGIGLWWLAAETIRLRAQIAELQAEQQARRSAQEVLERQVAAERSRNEDLARQVPGDQSPEKSTSLPIIATLFLPAGIARSAADRPKLLIAPSVETARIQVGLEPGDEYESFRAELRTLAGGEVLSQQNLKARTGRGVRSITLNIPASSLRTGEYELTLKGVSGNEGEVLGYYYFDVLRK